MTYDVSLLDRLKDVATWPEKDKTDLVETLLAPFRNSRTSTEYGSCELKREIRSKTPDEKYELRKLFAGISNDYLHEVVWILEGVNNDGTVYGYNAPSGHIESIRQVLTASPMLIHPAPTFFYAGSTFEGAPIGIFQIRTSAKLRTRVRRSNASSWETLVRDGNITRAWNDGDTRRSSLALQVQPILRPEDLGREGEIGLYTPKGERVSKHVLVTFPKNVKDSLLGEFGALTPFYSFVPIPLPQPRHIFSGTLYRALGWPLLSDRKTKLKGLLASLFERLQSQGIYYNVWTVAPDPNENAPRAYVTGVGASDLWDVIQRRKSARFAWFLSAGGVQYVLTSESHAAGFSLELTPYIGYIPTGKRIALLTHRGRVELSHPNVVQDDRFGSDLSVGLSFRWSAGVDYSSGPPALKSVAVGKARIEGYLGKEPLSRDRQSWRGRLLTVFKVTPESHSANFVDSRLNDFLPDPVVGSLQFRNRVEFDDSAEFDVGGFKVDVVMLPFSVPQEITIAFYDFSLSLFQ